MLKPKSLVHILRTLYPKVEFCLEIKGNKVQITVSDLDFYLSKEFEYFLNDFAKSLSRDEYMNLDFYPVV